MTAPPTDKEFDVDATADQMPPFPAVISQLRRGAAADELTAALADLAQQVQHTGKKGTLTLKLEVGLTSSGEALEITDDVSVKAPKLPNPATFFFADAHGGLHRHDPRQMTIDND